MVGPVSTIPLFEATTSYISANIHEFGGAPGTPIGSHMATVDRARDQWLQIVCTSVQSTKVPQEPSLIAEK